MVEARLEKLGLRARPGRDFELVNPNSDPRFRDYWRLYHNLMERKGVTVEVAKREMIRRTTLIGAFMVRQNEADAMLCGTSGESRHTPVLHRQCHRAAAGREAVRGDEHAAAAGAHGVHQPSVSV